MVRASKTWTLLSSLAQINSHFASFERMMPRGRWPTLTVLITSSLVLSMMLTVLSFSLVTYTV